MDRQHFILKTVVVGGMGANCYIFGDPKTKEVFIIDPGGDFHKIKSLINRDGLKVLSVINTHGHIDHISANSHFNIPIWIHKDDAPFLRDPKKNLSSLFGFGLKSPQASRLLSDGDVLKVGDISLEVIHTPGHTPGSICLKSDGILFTGDLLFCGGIGRTDFPYASEETLFRSLKDKILKYDDDTVVYPGHGPSTTIGQEKRSNPFL